MLPLGQISRGPNPTANLVSEREKENMWLSTRSILVFFCVLKRKLKLETRFIGGIKQHDK
jgi:hypothetical protein